MAVYVDGLEDYGSKGIRCHMVADTPEELESMRKRLGIKASWLHTSVVGGQPLPHYDLSPHYRSKAVQLGAVETTAVDIVRWYKKGINHAGL